MLHVQYAKDHDDQTSSRLACAEGRARTVVGLVGDDTICHNHCRDWRRPVAAGPEARVVVRLIHGVRAHAHARHTHLYVQRLEHVRVLARDRPLHLIDNLLQRHVLFKVDDTINIDIHLLHAHTAPFGKHDAYTQMHCSGALARNNRRGHAKPTASRQATWKR